MYNIYYHNVNMFWLFCQMMETFLASPPLRCHQMKRKLQHHKMLTLTMPI